MKTLAKYAAFARIAASEAARERGDLYGRLVFTAVILGVFSSLWRAVAEAGMPIALDPSRLVWYLAATEWIVLSPAHVHVEIEGEIRRGDIAYHLQRPFSYLAATMARGAGMVAVRAPFVGAAAFASAFVLTGSIPDVRAFAYVVPLGLVAMTLVFGLHVIIGLTAFWLSDVAPVFWVSQKLLFVLGGLMLPLALYPAWMQQIAHATPFPSMLAGPAAFMIGGAASDAGRLLVQLMGWGVVLTLTGHALFRRAVRTLQVNGG